MIVEIKYFYEKSNQDYEKYNELWNKNANRIIFLDTSLSYHQQLDHISNHIDDIKDILAIRYPLIEEIHNNKIMNDILSANELSFSSNKVWYPKEIWIYCPHRVENR